MQDVHFRISPAVLELIDKSAEFLGKTRSGILRDAVIYAIIGNTAQETYDQLALASDLIDTFRAQGSQFVQQGLDGDSTDLRVYMDRLNAVLELLPTFWRYHIIDVLREIPEFRVTERVL